MDTVMENLVKQFPIIPLSWSPQDSSLSLILEVLSFELKRSVTPSRTCSQNPHVSSHTPKTISSAPNVSSHTLSTSYLEERTTEYFTPSSQNDTSTQENTLTEASSISQEIIITQEIAATKAYTILQEITTTEASAITQENPRIGQVNSIFLCPHCADLIPFNGRHKHVIAHQIDNFKSQWQKCQRVATLQQANGIFTSVGEGTSTSTGLDTTRSTGIDTTRSTGMGTTRSIGNIRQY